MVGAAGLDGCWDVLLSGALGRALWHVGAAAVEGAGEQSLLQAIALRLRAAADLPGTATASHLLQVQWSHLDIAGPVWREKEGGATGFGAQLLAEWAIGQGK